MVTRRGCWGLTLALAAVPVPCQPLNRLAAQQPLRSYVCYRTGEAPVIDGRLDDPAWWAVPRSEPFVDILGDSASAPSLETRFSMLWDDDYLYVAAELEEPHVWATLTERDARIFEDDDFELFLDPDGDTHQYYELEINAFGTVWDLFLVKPYRDGGPAISAWDIRDLHAGIGVDGTLNDPSDTDRGWTVELAIPWRSIVEAAPGRRAPRPGEQWRLNFSRVDWDMLVIDGVYRKQVDAVTGSPLPERNWVWSPQGAVNMHMPERWGFVQFSERQVGTGADTIVEDADISVRQALRAVYDAQRTYRKHTDRYATSIAHLDLADLDGAELGELELQATPQQYHASLPARTRAGRWHIRQDGRVWYTQ
ncbi:MAG: carbohydrate-binding family 9-like protein [Gemmatimonas sp. SG8_28]|jgi:hypothetical protein|nr:MAG: carbohydrate-binding family 9-like protein [Gemmatimonas sp. SG8_28]